MDDFYRVDILSGPGKEFKAALDRLSDGDRLRAKAKFKQIILRLKNDPFSFGEELYDLHALGMQVRVGIDIPISIHFGVDATHRIAIIQRAAVVDRPAKP